MGEGGKFVTLSKGQEKFEQQYLIFPSIFRRKYFPFLIHKSGGGGIDRLCFYTFYINYNNFVQERDFIRNYQFGYTILYKKPASPDSPSKLSEDFKSQVKNLSDQFCVSTKIYKNCLKFRKNRAKTEKKFAHKSNRPL